MTGVTQPVTPMTKRYNEGTVPCRTCGNTFINQVSFYKHWRWPTDQLGRQCQSRAGMDLRGWTFETIHGEKAWVSPRVEDLSSSFHPLEGVADTYSSGATALPLRGH